MLLNHNHLQTHLSNTPVTLIADTNTLTYRKKKTRLLVKKGNENIPLPLEQVVLFYTQDKLVYVIDRFLKKYIFDKTLSELATELDSAIFFRCNRHYVLNINYIKSFRTYERVKLLIDLTIPEINHVIIISQETAAAFRKWIQEA